MYSSARTADQSTFQGFCLSAQNLFAEATDVELYGATSNPDKSKPFISIGFNSLFPESVLVCRKNCEVYHFLNHVISIATMAEHAEPGRNLSTKGAKWPACLLHLLGPSCPSC